MLLKVTFSTQEIDAIDGARACERNPLPRATWVRKCVRDALGPSPPPIERSPEPEPEFEEPRVDKWGNPVGTTYDEDDPRGWT